MTDDDGYSDEYRNTDYEDTDDDHVEGEELQQQESGGDHPQQQPQHLGKAHIQEDRQDKNE